MSRSIHTTARDFLSVHRSDYADPAHQRAILRRIYDGIQKKRLVKAKVRADRKREVWLKGPARPGAIPVHVRDQGKFVHYPASRGDFIAFMQQLPGDVLDGIQSVELCLGAEYQTSAEAQVDSEMTADPFTGRLGYGILQNVYSGRALGAYEPEPPRIRVFAYVYDKPREDMDPLEMYLRIQMLGTFLHEIGHHLEAMQHNPRGRWLALSHDKREGRARRIQKDWARLYVMPFLRRKYPSKFENFRKSSLDYLVGCISGRDWGTEPGTSIWARVKL